MRQVSQLLDIARGIDAGRAREMESRLGGRLRPGSRAMAIAALLGAAYPALALVVEAHPDIAERLAEEGFQTARDRATYLTRLRARIGADDGVGWDVDVTRRELRRFARDERIRVALREALPASAGGADVDVTSAELGALADATIEVALEEAQHAVSARFGVPVTASGGDGRFVVLGMGKLGGDELNAGSDVDLIYFYDTDDGEVVPRIQEAGEGISGVGGEERGATRTRPRSSMPPVGDGGITLHDYWSRVAKRLTATLEEVTEDGFVWRVDLRLRPEGRSGPIVNSLAAAERYYESFGRLWERAALLRARPVAGSLALGDEFLRDLAPFVWRKRVSPQVATDMIALVHRARAELSHDADRDLKLGPGGIREAEFFVQSLQLIWGGVEVRARAQGTLDGLRRLRALGYVTDREGREIAEGYLALRRAEHAVQSATGVQTHALPASGEEMERLARLLRFKGQGAFLTELAAHRARIAARFLSLLPQGSQPPSRWVEAAAALDRGDREGFIEALARDAGHLLKETTYGSDLELPDRFRDLGNDLFELGRHPDGLLGARTRESFSRLPEILLDAVMDAADAEQAARYLRIYSVRLRVPGVYTSMLGADPRLLRRLIEALGSSAFIGDALVGNPDLADFVLFARGAPTPEVIRRSIETALGEEPPDLDPEEAVVGALRRARARVTIDVGLADLSGEMDTRATTLALSTLADATLEVATRFALGTPPGEPVRGLCVVAMGKLGGRELGYGSDLDVFFLFDPTRAAPGSPGAGMDPDTYFARCARRIIRLISVSHGAGPGYELDTRLRPSGSQGMLVTSLEGFARYHGIRKAGSAADPERRVGVRAAAWERLALLRARPAAGDMEIGAEAMGIAEQAAYGQVEDFRRTVEEIHRLRGRMERELSNERRGRRDLKMGRGGLVDIEFAVQLLQMRHGADPSVRTQETPAAIDALAEGGYLSPAQAETLRDGYGFLRKLDQRSRVVNADPSHLLESGGPGVPSLARRMGIRGRTAAETAAELFARYAEITERVRAAYEDIVARLLVQEAPSGGVLDPRASSGGVG